MREATSEQLLAGTMINNFYQDSAQIASTWEKRGLASLQKYCNLVSSSNKLELV